MARKINTETDFAVQGDNCEKQSTLSSRVRECAVLAGSGDILAERTGIPRRTLETYLSGRSEPKAARLASIIEATGVSAYWILTGKGPMMEDGSPVESQTEEEILKEYALIPGYNIQVAAGAGAFPEQNVKPSRKLAFRHKWLRFRGLREKDLVLVFAKGDSMEPTISDNNTLLIDTSQRDLQDGNIYVIRTDGHLIVKRVQQLLNKNILFISDNKTYEKMEVSPQDLNDLEIIGKVAWIGKDV